jgi:small GTP-binding protein
MTIISQKICLVGDFGVGKTSLVRRYVEGKFSDRYLTTVGVKISRKIIELSPSTQVQLLIWDIEGQTKFKAIAPSYLQGAKAAIIVADVNRIDTIEHISSHIELFNSINPGAVCLVAFNKTDLITPETINKLVQIYNFEPNQRVAKQYITSAKTGHNTEQMFYTIANLLVES